MPLLGCSNERATFAFLDRVLKRFGAPSEVFTNQGMEFHGKFQKLCEKVLIDHHTLHETILR
jgi:hypothetical protein